MKRVLFIYSRVEDRIEASGEANKMKMQMSALDEYGIHSDIIYHNRNVNANKILIRLPIYSIYGKPFIQKVCKVVDQYDAIYIRKYVFDHSFILLLKEIRRINPGIKIILEIPTYPYDQEWSTIVDKPLLLKDKLFRNTLFRYVNRIITFSDDEYIFKIKCINTSNGINPDVYKSRELKNPCEKKEAICLLGVATLEKWHGYDRVLKGIYDYNKKSNRRRVEFHIVGEGAEKANLERLAHSLELDDVIFFHGALYGKDLDTIFNSCDIGIGSLGMHRIGLINGYTLKLREYMSRGIPFIYGYNDKLIEKNPVPYMLKVPGDETAIDIETIVQFYQFLDLENNSNKIGSEMHLNAVNYLSWKSQMEPIADYINGMESR